jgi:hypothetical protein
MSSRQKFLASNGTLSPQICLHLFIVVGLVRLCDPESNTEDSFTISRVTLAGKIKG